MARISGLDADLQLMVDETLSPQAQSKFVADFARDELAKAKAQNAAALGYAPDYDTFVDGRKGAPLESVHVPGTILFTFDAGLLADLFEYIDSLLVQSSPLLTGRYQKSHEFFADGIEADFEKPPQAREYAFINTAPYSRKIERGESKRAPNGVYEAVAAMAAARYGNLARIRFSYRAPLVSYASKRANSDARVPAIVITVKG